MPAMRHFSQHQTENSPNSSVADLLCGFYEIRLVDAPEGSISGTVEYKALS